jgi:hypothetical protein
MLQEVVRRSGLTYPTVELVEKHKTQPSLKTLDAITEVTSPSDSLLIGSRGLSISSVLFDGGAGLAEAVVRDAGRMSYRCGLILFCAYG